MEKIVKGGLAVVLGIGAIYTIKKVTDGVGAAVVGKELIIDASNFAPFRRRFSLSLTNQVNKPLRYTKPSVVLYIGDKQVAYSKTSNTQYVLPPLGTSSKMTINLEIMDSAVSELISAFSSKVWAKYRLYANGIPTSGTVVLREGRK